MLRAMETGIDQPARGGEFAENTGELRKRLVQYLQIHARTSDPDIRAILAREIAELERRLGIARSSTG